MGHFCKICKRIRPNEKFSGKGHKIHLCKACQAMHKDKRQLIELNDELHNFVLQSHISEKNLKRLKALSHHEDKRVAEMAGLIYEMALVTPYKRKRISRLLRTNKQLLRKLSEAGLLDFYFEDFKESFERESEAIIVFDNECDDEEFDGGSDEIETYQPTEEEMDWLRKRNGEEGSSGVPIRQGGSAATAVISFQLDCLL